MMVKIELLDELTINKIAAGEVIERPLSVVKELVENSIDAGATAITVEIRSGGIDFIRVTDNGSGIPQSEVRNAFLPHATSKIKSAEDLFDIRSLGFRGEALSTIAAVAQVEMVTKTKDQLTGVLIKLDGGREISFEEVGSGEGTTFIARNLFINVPARRKFLKSAMTEAGYITEFIQKIAIERSDIAFKYVINNDNKLVTSGNGSVKDNIYRVYGRDISDSLISVGSSDNGMSITGYIARPLVARNNRRYEVFFVNGHAVSDKVLEKAAEAAYKPFLMQHKYPFLYLFLSLDPGMVDVNVHPRKSEVKFSLGNTVYDFVVRSVEQALKSVELINRVELVREEETEYKAEETAFEPFENAPEIDHLSEMLSSDRADERPGTGFFVEAGEPDRLLMEETESYTVEVTDNPDTDIRSQNEENKTNVQMDLFEDRIIEPSNEPDFNIIGCVFDTYWIIEYKDRMLMIDQHAAHEKVKYEEFLKDYKEKKVVSQYVDPPVLIKLSGRQEDTLKRYSDAFASLGFEIDRFDRDEYALRAVPSGFMKLNDKDIFTGLIDELDEVMDDTSDVSLIHDRLAQMSCKAAVKGGNRLSVMEARELLKKLLKLDNPYNCPHGRPTMVEFTERDLEKFFKRVL
ncbi:MAG: DNA mismatch repair endonuclease MutL [Lachnospiraceae bacterium]|nr:DNA mismatch repair endonuclease MutL [Lachnospiraceae bacterium]